MRDWNAHQIEANLRMVFAETDSTIALDLLSNYLAGAQIALMQWWLEKRRHHTVKDLTQAFHSLQHAAIYQAFALKDESV